MSGLTETTYAMCLAIAKNEHSRLRDLALVAATQMKPERCEKILETLKGSVHSLDLKYWVQVQGERSPWLPLGVTEQLEGWLLEAKHQAVLSANGERVYPLLLSGETRCGKTSTLTGLAKKLGYNVYRMSLASVVGSYLGDSAVRIKSAFSECSKDPDGLWILDEIDGVSQKRLNDTSAGQERTHTVATLLAELEMLPSNVRVAATTNCLSLIDPAVLARFTVVKFPTWEGLSTEQRELFGESHGLLDVIMSKSYSEVVQTARFQRVHKLINQIEKESK